MFRGGEGRIGCGLVAEVPVVDRVARRGVMDLRLTRLRRARRVGDRGQLRILNLDLFRGVSRLRISIRDDDGDVIAHVAHLALGERWMGARLHRRAVLRMDHPAADEAADLIGRDVVAGEDRNHAQRLEGGGKVDFVDCRVGVRRAEKIREGLAVTIDVVDIMALAGDEPDVLCSFDRGAECCHAHDVSLPWDGIEASLLFRRLRRCGGAHFARALGD